MLNNTPVMWISKRQKNVETSTYGSELVASIVGTKLILEVRFMLRSLGIDLDGPMLMLGDNMSVFLIKLVPSSVLRKKHNAIAYYRVRESIADKVIRFSNVKGEENVNDILTKLICNDFHVFLLFHCYLL